MKLTLRDLFWLVFVAALLAGWFVHYRTLRAGWHDDNLRHARQVIVLSAENGNLQGRNSALKQELAEQVTKCSGQAKESP